MFGVLEEHRHWCPWVALNTVRKEDRNSPNSGSLKLPGWKIVLLNVLPSLRQDISILMVC